MYGCGSARDQFAVVVDLDVVGRILRERGSRITRARLAGEFRPVALMPLISRRVDRDHGQGRRLAARDGCVVWRVSGDRGTRAVDVAFEFDRLRTNPRFVRRVGVDYRTGMIDLRNSARGRVGNRIGEVRHRGERAGGVRRRQIIPVRLATWERQQEERHMATCSANPTAW